MKLATNDLDWIGNLLRVEVARGGLQKHRAERFLKLSNEIWDMVTSEEIPEDVEWELKKVEKDG
jgi:hypothetical protein